MKLQIPTSFASWSLLFQHHQAPWNPEWNQVTKPLVGSRMEGNMLDSRLFMLEVCRLWNNNYYNHFLVSLQVHGLSLNHNILFFQWNITEAPGFYSNMTTRNYTIISHTAIAAAPLEPNERFRWKLEIIARFNGAHARNYSPLPLLFLKQV